MSRLIHLNGPPGIGKSTIARRYVDDHFGVLNCDIDILRTLVGGWADDFAAAGALIRPAALGMIGGYLANGRDVILPQMLLDPRELALFESCAHDAGAQFVERFLMDSPDSAVSRFSRRGASTPDDPWHDHVRTIVTANGGEHALRNYHASLTQLIEQRPHAQVIASIEDSPDMTYAALIYTLL